MYLPAMPEDTIPDLLPVLAQKDPNGKFYGKHVYAHVCGLNSQVSLQNVEC